MNGSEPRIVLAMFAIAFVVGGSAYLVAQKQDNNTPARASQRQVSELIAAVGALVDLPNEDPVVTVITDTTQLQQQPFFSEVRQGDRVLVFNQARKAFIYSPRDHRIVQSMDLAKEPSQ